MPSTSRLAALFDVCRSIWNERPDLAAQFGSVESLGYWTWLMSTGWREERRLREVLPVPPRHLIRRVHGEADDDYFQESALSDGGNILTRLFAQGVELGPGKRVLDFGCGCARILRIFARFADAAELHGIDIDREAIAWNRSAFDFMRFEIVDSAPPAPYPDGLFDTVHAYSVFSHLDRDLSRRWLAELRRISKPNATVILTVQGTHCARRFAEGDAFGMTFPAAEVVQRDLPRLAEDGFVYYRYPAMPDVPASITDSQGMTFVTERFVRAEWSQWFDVVAYDVAPSGWQDFVVLRPVWGAR